MCFSDFALREGALIGCRILVGSYLIFSHYTYIVITFCISQGSLETDMSKIFHKCDTDCEKYVE